MCAYFPGNMDGYSSEGSKSFGSVSSAISFQESFGEHYLNAQAINKNNSTSRNDMEVEGTVGSQKSLFSSAFNPDVLLTQEQGSSRTQFTGISDIIGPSVSFENKNDYQGINTLHFAINYVIHRSGPYHDEATELELICFTRNYVSYACAGRYLTLCSPRMMLIIETHSRKIDWLVNKVWIVFEFIIMHANALPQIPDQRWCDFFIHQAENIEVMDDVYYIRVALCKVFHSFYGALTIDAIKKKMAWCGIYHGLWDRKKFHREKKKKNTHSILGGQIPSPGTAL